MRFRRWYMLRREIARAEPNAVSEYFKNLFVESYKLRKWSDFYIYTCVWRLLLRPLMFINLYDKYKFNLHLHALAIVPVRGVLVMRLTIGRTILLGPFLLLKFGMTNPRSFAENPRWKWDPYSNRRTYYGQKFILLLGNRNFVEAGALKICVKITFYNSKQYG